MRKQRVVLEVRFNKDKDKKKALQALSGLSRIDSLSMDMKSNKLTVIGVDVDPVVLSATVHKSGRKSKQHVMLCSVEEEKDEQRKVHEIRGDGKIDDGEKTDVTLDDCMKENGGDGKTKDDNRIKKDKDGSSSSAFIFRHPTGPEPGDTDSSSGDEDQPTDHLDFDPYDFTDIADRIYAYEIEEIPSFRYLTRSQREICPLQAANLHHQPSSSHDKGSLEVEFGSQKKVIFKVELNDDKVKQKAMRLIFGISGVNSISIDMKSKKLTVIGDKDKFDTMDVLEMICKSFPKREQPAIDVVFVELVTNQEKKDHLKMDARIKDNGKDDGKDTKEM